MFLGDEEFKPVVGLYMDNYEYSFIKDSYTEILFHFKDGSASNCSLLDNFVPGLFFDFQNNKIKGYPMVEINSIFTFYCYNSFSTTFPTSFSLRITNNLVHGIVGTYMKSSSFDTNCSTIYTQSSNDISTQIARVENYINHPYTGNVEIWDGLNNDFAAQYIINWDGYLKVDTPGNYFISMSSSDSSWLYIDDNIVLDNPGCHNYTEKTRLITFNTFIYAIKIVFVKNFGGAGFELNWKSINDNNYTNIFPNLYYVPISSFIYKYVIGTYIIGITIPNNIPIFEINKIPLNFQINPSLPSGLNIDYLTGIISGTPIKDSNTNVKTIYTITAFFSDDINLSTTITITIIENIKPAGIYLIDNETGERLTAINKILGLYMNVICQTEVGLALSFNISIVPKGLYFNTESGRLYGILSEIIDIPITFYAFSRDGISSSQIIPFKISNNCTGNNKLHLIYYGTTSDVKSELNTTFIFTPEDSSTSIAIINFFASSQVGYSPSVCIPPGKYQLQVADNFPAGNYVDYIIYVNGLRVANFTLKTFTISYFNIDTSILFNFRT